MSITVVVQQMIIIFILIGIGVVLFKKKLLSETTSKQISGLIVNITNPALLICSAFDEGPKVSMKELGFAFVVSLIVYAVLLVVSILLPYLLRVPKPYHYSYQMLAIFGNVGFIGIPLASAVLGSESLIFVSIYNLIYNILIYTLGISILQRAAEKLSRKDTPDAPEMRSDTSPLSDTQAKSGVWKKLVNAGTISAVVTITFYLGNFSVPVIVTSTLTYIGRATTLLSMLVLGVSVAQMAMKDIFSQPRLYIFTLLRQILIPIGCVLAMRPFIENTLILNTAALMLAVPAGNMPLMLSKQLNIDTDTISQGIILTTILSLATIPLVSLFL